MDHKVYIGSATELAANFKNENLTLARMSRHNFYKSFKADFILANKVLKSEPIWNQKCHDFFCYFSYLFFQRHFIELSTSDHLEGVDHTKIINKYYW